MVIRGIVYDRDNRATGYEDSCESEDSDVENVVLNENKHTFLINIYCSEINNLYD